MSRFESVSDILDEFDQFFGTPDESEEIFLGELDALVADLGVVGVFGMDLVLHGTVTAYAAEQLRKVMKVV